MARSRDSQYWRMTDHACRHCGGRILRKRTERGAVYCCAGCEVQSVGDHRVICACGVRVAAGPNRGMSPFRCVVVAERRPDHPARIGIAYGSGLVLPEGQGADPAPMELREPDIGG